MNVAKDAEMQFFHFSPALINRVSFFYIQNTFFIKGKTTFEDIYLMIIKKLKTTQAPFTGWWHAQEGARGEGGRLSCHLRFTTVILYKKLLIRFTEWDVIWVKGWSICRKEQKLDRGLLALVIRNKLHKKGSLCVSCFNVCSMEFQFSFSCHWVMPSNHCVSNVKADKNQHNCGNGWLVKYLSVFLTHFLTNGYPFSFLVWKQMIRAIVFQATSERGMRNSSGWPRNCSHIFIYKLNTF